MNIIAVWFIDIFFLRDCVMYSM